MRHLAQQLTEAIQPNGKPPQQQPEIPGQRRNAAAGEAIEQAKEQNRAVDGNIAFTNGNFESHRAVADKPPRLPKVVRVQASSLAVRLQTGHVRRGTRVGRLFAKKKPRAESQLVTGCTVNGVNGFGRGGQPRLHQSWCEKRQTDIQPNQQVEHQQPMLAKPVDKPLGGVDATRGHLPPVGLAFGRRPQRNQNAGAVEVAIQSIRPNAQHGGAPGQFLGQPDVLGNIDRDHAMRHFALQIFQQAAKRLNTLVFRASVKHHGDHGVTPMLCKPARRSPSCNMPTCM